jgi:hypothetical protein
MSTYIGKSDERNIVLDAIRLTTTWVTSATAAPEPDGDFSDDFSADDFAT